MTSAERAWKLVQEKKDRRLDVAACARFAASLPNGGGSLADIDDALWLSEVIDAAVANALDCGRAVTVPTCGEQPRVRCLGCNLSLDEARFWVADLQAQIDALDPDAAIAEAERKMVEAFWRGACAGVAASFDGFAKDFAASDPLNCDWRVDGCRQIASNMRANAKGGGA